MEEILTGTVKGPGENPHEFKFITTLAFIAEKP